MMIQYDLHIHTTASDGLFTPEQIVDKALQRGLKGIAITDHDAFEGIEAATRYAAVQNPDFVVLPGIEINTNIEGTSVHVLGYGIDFRAPGFQARIQEMRSWREERAQGMVEKLRKLGYAITYEEVAAVAAHSLGRPHIARVLAQKGAIPSEQWAFSHLLTHGKPAYVPRHAFTPWDAAELIHAFGGVCVLAHPGLIPNQKLAESFLDVVPAAFDGVEVHYPAHLLYQVKKYEAWAEKRGLLITGGSDFHGHLHPEHGGYVGFRGIDDANMQRLKNTWEILQKKLDFS